MGFILDQARQVDKRQLWLRGPQGPNIRRATIPILEVTLVQFEILQCGIYGIGEYFGVIRMPGWRSDSGATAT